MQEANASNQVLHPSPEHDGSALRSTRQTRGHSSGTCGEIDLMPRNDVLLTVLAFMLTTNVLAVLVVARAHLS
jgi:hypothetical protein